MQSLVQHIFDDAGFLPTVDKDPGSCLVLHSKLPRRFLHHAHGSYISTFSRSSALTQEHLEAGWTHVQSTAALPSNCLTTSTLLTVLQSSGHPVAHTLSKDTNFLSFLSVTRPENLGDDELPVILVEERELFTPLGTTAHFEDGQYCGDGSSHLFTGG